MKRKDNKTPLQTSKTPLQIGMENLGELLKRADLPSDPKKVIGRVFHFEAIHGDTLVGTITAITLGVTDGVLELSVTNKKIYGEDIICLIKMKDGWAAYVEQKYEDTRTEDRFYPGNLQLL